MNIYSNFKPTYLYIKTHNVTGLQYFGKTINDPFKYKGSGKRWLNHLKIHGNNVTTSVIGYYTDVNSCIDVAIKFSAEHNIVESTAWANIIPENGINGGGTASQLHTVPVREQAALTCLARYGKEHPSLVPSIKLKAKVTHIQRYGDLGCNLNSSNSIAKRNKTNLIKYGNACAANKDGNKSSIIAQRTLRSRPVILELKFHAYKRKISLPSNWVYKDDDWLNNTLSTILKLPVYAPDISMYNNSQLSRYNKLNRPQVIRLLEISNLLDIKLGKNWFQQSDYYISNLLDEVLITISDSHLPTSLQFLKDII